MYYAKSYTVIYEKDNKDLLYRQLQHRPVYKIGTKNNYGWLVKDILYNINDKSYTEEEYQRILKKNERKVNKKYAKLSLSTLLRNYIITFKNFLELIAIAYIIYKLFSQI